MGALREAGTCPSCYAVSEAFLATGVCPVCPAAPVGAQARERLTLRGQEPAARTRRVVSEAQRAGLVKARAARARNRAHAKALAARAAEAALVDGRPEAFAQPIVPAAAKAKAARKPRPARRAEREKPAPEQRAEPGSVLRSPAERLASLRDRERALAAAMAPCKPLKVELALEEYEAVLALAERLGSSLRHATREILRAGLRAAARWEVVAAQPPGVGPRAPTLMTPKPLYTRAPVFNGAPVPARPESYDEYDEPVFGERVFGTIFEPADPSAQPPRAPERPALATRQAHDLVGLLPSSSAPAAAP